MSVTRCARRQSPCSVPQQSKARGSALRGRWASIGKTFPRSSGLCSQMYHRVRTDLFLELVWRRIWLGDKSWTNCRSVLGQHLYHDAVREVVRDARASSCLTFSSLDRSMTEFRLARNRARRTILISNHRNCLPGKSLSHHTRKQFIMICPTFHTVVKRLVTDVRRIVDATGSIRHINFTRDPTLSHRKIKARQRAASLRIHLNTKNCVIVVRCGHIIHQGHTPFSIQLMSASENFNTTRESSALQDNYVFIGRFCRRESPRFQLTHHRSRPSRSSHHKCQTRVDGAQRKLCVHRWCSSDGLTNDFFELLQTNTKAILACICRDNA